ncbi:hypothetical protein MAM1_0564d10928 [Mucor ambiguus]|uniref:RING-type E3 ubiquitin transferase BRCA1 n=1 Tax=Mucor ambiguus TaxID=91626 RepID=A0A0C9MVE4_9FUNG|nr:hypothetical protein MAM1_0564d10928 [Mucor ambiguus]
MAGIMRELQCDICRSILNEASTTFCGHTFCRSCITKEIDERRKCPACGKKATIDQLNPAEPYQSVVGHFMQMKQEFERVNGIDLSTAEIMDLSVNSIADRDMEVLPEAADTNQDSQLSTELPTYRILQMTENPIKHIDIPDARLEHKVTADVTHAVFDTAAGTNGLVKNTQKYRMAIACGYHIVNEAWLKISIEKGFVQPDDRFSVWGDLTYGRTGAPKKALDSRLNKKGHLLRHLKVGLIGDVKGEYRKYLMAARAQVGDFDDLIVCKPDQDIETLRSKYPGKNLISYKWIEASICRYELDDKSQYIL